MSPLAKLGFGGCSLCRSPSPIRRAWNGQRDSVRNVGRDEHGFIAGEHGLAKGHDLPGLVHGFHCPRTVHAVGLVLKRFLGFPIVAVQPAVLMHSSIPPHGLRRNLPHPPSTPGTSMLYLASTAP